MAEMEQSAPVIERLPKLEEVERDIARNIREARVLRVLRDVLRKNLACERASDILRRREGVQDAQ